MQPIPRQRCIVLDLDDTILFSRLNGRSELYTAAGLDAAEKNPDFGKVDEEKYLESYISLGNATRPFEDLPLPSPITFIAVTAFNELFKTIADINDEKGKDTISLKIMTSNVYMKQPVKAQLEAKFSNFHRISNLASYKFYNKRNLVGKGAGWHGVPLSVGKNVRWEGEKIVAHFAKAQLMKDQLTNWQELQENLEPQFITLVEDDLATCEGAKEFGYSALHLPTRKMSEAPDVVGPSIDDRIYQFIQSLKEFYGMA